MNTASSRDNHAGQPVGAAKESIPSEQQSDINPPPKASKPVDPHVALIAELAALVDGLAGQTPNAHHIQARVAALRARIDAL